MQRTKEDLTLLLLENPIFKIDSKSDGIVFFHLTSVQKKIVLKILEFWNQGKQAKIVIVKGRQQRVTSLIQLIGLTLVLTIKGFKAYTMAHNLESVRDIFEQKIKFAFDSLPDYFKNLYKANRNKARQLLFDGEMQKSSITVGDKGRGGTYQMLHISEPGMMSMDKKKWNEMKSGTLPAAEFADLIIFESTADGGLGKFYEFVMENLKENSEYYVLFLSWTESEEYSKPAPENKSWIQEYKTLARDYELCENPMKTYEINENQFYWYFIKARNLKEQVKVQYPFSLQEAFISAGSNYFLPRLILEAKEKASKLNYRIDGDFKIFEEPNPNCIYTVGIDVATGESKDSSCIQVLNANTGKQVAVATGKWEERVTAKYAYNVGVKYNLAYLAPEINSFGRAVMSYILEFGYPENKIYKRIEQDVTKQKITPLGDFGWSTNGVTRPLLISQLRDAFHDKVIEVNDIQTLDEMMVFINNDGKYEAQSGYNDDTIIALGIAYQAIQYAINYGI